MKIDKYCKASNKEMIMAVLTSLGIPDVTGNTTTLMPKLSYRFRVTFIGDAFTATPTRNVMQVSRPSLSHDPVQIDAYNSRIYLLGKHTWEPVQVVLRDDVDSIVLKEINNQMNRQVDHALQSSVKSGSAYKFSMIVETLDGGNPNPGVLDRFEFAGCYIQTVNYGDMNYGDSNMVTTQMQIRYDNCEIYDANGRATLTGATQDQTLVNATGGQVAD